MRRGADERPAARCRPCGTLHDASHRVGNGRGAQRLSRSRKSRRHGPGLSGCGWRYGMCLMISNAETICPVLPRFSPMLAATGAITDGVDGWAFEPKLDRWRALVYVDAALTPWSGPASDVDGSSDPEGRPRPRPSSDATRHRPGPERCASTPRRAPPANRLRCVGRAGVDLRG